MPSGKIRKAVFARDKGICALCGLDCIGMEDAIWRVVQTMPPHFSSTLIHAIGKRASKFPDGSPWEADHIKPRCEGGSDSLLNLRTLCLECHAQQTRVLLRKLSAPRRGFEWTNDLPPESEADILEETELSQVELRDSADESHDCNMYDTGVIQ